MTLKCVRPDGDVVSVQEFENPWGFQPFVWTALCDAYTVAPDEHPMERWLRLWEFAADGEPLQWYDWNVLVFGYDHVITPLVGLALLSESLRRFHSTHGHNAPGNHCIGLADAIDKVPGHTRGVCIHGSSVSDDLWKVRIDDYEYRNYNVDRDDSHSWAELRYVPQT